MIDLTATPAAVTEPDPPRPWADPVGWLRGRFTAATLGALAFPLVVLFFIYFFDEFDTAAFGVLAPEIKNAFHLTDRAFVNLIALNLVIVLGAAVPLGYYGDRLPRKRLVVAGAVIAGVFSFATGLAPSLLALVLFRMGNGFGVLVNGTIHPSLLSDYYRPQARPTTFAMHNNSQRWGSIAGPVIAGVVAWLSSWRVAFLILIVPILAMAIVATRLPKVVRGQSDNEDAAVIAADERPVPLGRGVRMLLAVKTLRWQFAAYVAIGAAFLPLSAYVPLYFQRVFHINSADRGFLLGAGAVAALVGVQMSGRVTRTWIAKGLGEPLKLAGYSLLAVGPCLLVMAFAPNLVIAVVGLLAAYFVGGFYYPPFLTVQALVSPARVRTLSLSFGLLFLVAGLITFQIVFGAIADHNIRNGLGATIPFWFIGGFILRAGHRFVTSDTEHAFSVLATTAEMRKARLEMAQRSILSVRGVDVSYGPVQVLFGVDLEVAEGEILALLGTNGAGKSTLLRAISGLVPIHGGAIFFDGEDITGLEPEESFALGLVQVPGGKGIFPSLTVAENLEVAVWASRRPPDEVAAAREEVLDLFPALRRRYDQPAAVLSGGEQQMLTLGQAFISKPKLLMIDELSLGLAPVVVEELLGVVRRLHASGTSVVLVEQSVNVALTLSTRAVFMEKGEVRFTGPTAELLDRDDILRAVFLTGATTLEGAK
ncbi:MAG TPA: ATP-binding protein [Acidimicrobiales bacterium]|nr:ATP-binding protein [Acidimicrobiales bacterium]